MTGVRFSIVATSWLLSIAFARAETYIVIVKDFEFKPKKVHLIQGDTIRWENHDIDAGHSVQITMPGVAESDKFYPDESYSFTFNQVGDFAYHCGYHPGMKGMVYVIADPSRPPDISNQMAPEQNSSAPQENETPKVEKSPPEAAPVEKPVEQHDENNAHRERISK